MNRIIVTDRKSFVEFLEFFQKDLNENKEKWENQTLPSFFGAMEGYADDIQGFYNNMKTELGDHINADIPSWQTFADILQGARYYEG